MLGLSFFKGGSGLPPQGRDRAVPLALPPGEGHPLTVFVALRAPAPPVYLLGGRPPQTPRCGLRPQGVLVVSAPGYVCFLWGCHPGLGCGLRPRGIVVISAFRLLFDSFSFAFVDFSGSILWRRLRPLPVGESCVGWASAAMTVGQVRALVVRFRVPFCRECPDLGRTTNALRQERQSLEAAGTARAVLGRADRAGSSTARLRPG